MKENGVGYMERFERGKGRETLVILISETKY